MSENKSPLPQIEIEIYVNADGSVTFADLAEDMVEVARRLNPDQALACDAPPIALSHNEKPHEQD